MSTDPSNLQGSLIEEDETFVLLERTVNPYIVNFHAARGFRAEQIRGLRNKLLVMNHEDMPRSLAITSAIQGEGKTVTAINLGIALAELEEQRIIVLDLDLRKPCVESFLGLVPDVGITELLLGAISLKKAIRPSGMPGLDIIGAGHRHVMPSELLLSRRVDELLAQLKEEYSYILVDTPPTIPINDAGILGRKCDGTLMVIALENSPRTLVKEALRNLEDHGSNVLGCFVTGVRGADPSSDERYSYPEMED